uniref:Uncharacterized protein n=1 Tax=Oryza meridionalis TaxID=40149 RepID=A0A0E0F7R6_9ORYZ
MCCSIPSIRRRRRKRSAEGAMSCQYLRCHLTTLKCRRHHATGGQVLLRLAGATVYPRLCCSSHRQAHEMIPELNAKR